MQLTDQRITIIILGAVIVLGMIGIVVLKALRQPDAASIVNIVTTAVCVLCPSPLGHKGADDAKQ